MNPIKKTIKQMKAKGYSNTEILRMREMAKKHSKAMEQDATEKAFLYMLAIPLNVLVNDYWSKSAKKRAPKFIDDVISLCESVEAGVVTDKELADLLFEYAGVEIKAEWLSRNEKEA